MRFICSQVDPIRKACFAHMFLESAAKNGRLGEISNMDEVLSALDPLKIARHYLDLLSSDERPE